LRNKKYDLNKIFSSDSISAIDAKFEAQKIAFAPFAFQAAKSMRDLGILKVIDEAGERGIFRDLLLDELNISNYALGVLLEMGLSSGILKILDGESPWKYHLGKVGYFLLHDPMTIANMDFMHDVCYEGNFKLDESLKNGRPEGLKVFGDWPTIYEGLSSLPEDVQKSWFAFDHYYSDGAFPAALNYVFSTPHKKLMDIGGNTAKWAISCMNHDSDMKVTIIDLPGQAEMARKTISDQGFSERIDVYEANILKEESKLPKGCDAVWMSQFLDCFSLDEITGILNKVFEAVDENCSVYVMEPLWDKQRYEAASYSLHATSLYFTTMANGNSKMYESGELTKAIEKAGFSLDDDIHFLGPNDYSILQFKKRKNG
jgi:hypothetical protein